MDFIKREIVSINAAAFLIGAAGFLSRILGLFRDRLLAGRFGASRELDIYYAAFQIPDFIFNLFLIGSATAAIIPVFLEYWEKDKEEAKRLIENLFNIFLVFSAVFCVLAAIFTPFFIRFLVPGFSVEEQALASLMARIMLASPFFLSLSNIVSGVLQAHRRFFVFSLSSVFYNLGIIFGILVFLPAFGFLGLAYGVILGAFLHFFVQLPVFFILGFRLRPVLSFKLSAGILRIIKLSGPRVLAISFTSISVLVVTAIASTLSQGSISVMQFANNIKFIPVGILGVSFAVAAFPRLSHAFIKKDADDFYSSFFGVFKTIVFWLAPVSVLFYVLRAHIIRLALGTGLFDWRDTRLTAAILGIFSLVIIIESILPLLIKSFYALNKTVRPLIINLISNALIVLLAFWFAGIFSDTSSEVSQFFGRILRVGDISDLGIIGIALAVVMGQFLNFFVLLRFFLGEARSAFGFVPKNVFAKDIFRFLAVAILAGVVAYIMRVIIDRFITLDTFVGVLIQGGGAAIAGLLVYGLILYKFENKEIMDVVEVFRRRLLKPQVLPQGIELDK